ncbi:hypothetical protein [Bacillus smithii]|uniref:hypothetical protein n=1 Tax=Bacillus smithii TaxID=1479 RepID=UPI0030C9B47C
MRRKNLGKVTFAIQAVCWITWIEEILPLAMTTILSQSFPYEQKQKTGLTKQTVSPLHKRKEKTSSLRFVHADNETTISN